MVVSSSKLANTLFSMKLNTHITPIILNCNQMNIEVDTLRGKSVTSNINGLKEALAHSNIFFIYYVERMKI